MHSVLVNILDYHKKKPIVLLVGIKSKQDNRFKCVLIMHDWILVCQTV